MLARSSILRHPSGTTLKTPLLVPSFSSKGFRFDKKKISEIKDIFRNTAEVLFESMLVSAYDIYYGHLPQPKKFPCSPSLTIIDSGGYETGVDHDFSTIYKYVYKTQIWELRHLYKVLDSWPIQIPAVFVSFDKDSAGKSISTQLDNARALFSRYPGQLHNFLIKPTRKCKNNLSNTIKLIQPVIKEFGAFHIIGVTEKELGDTVLDRMETIALLRRSLDDVGVLSPIQVFGALDPLSSSLYFLSGAEIFDGLSWLRFAYSNGYCIYRPNYGVLKIGIDVQNDPLEARILSDNYYEMKRLQLSMQDFVGTTDFLKLEPHAEILRKAKDSLASRIGGDV